MPTVSCCSGSLPDDLYIHLSGTCPCLTDDYQVTWQPAPSRIWHGSKQTSCSGNSLISFDLRCSENAAGNKVWKLSVECPSGSNPDNFSFQTWNCSPFKIEDNITFSSNFGCCPNGSFSILIDTNP